MASERVDHGGGGGGAGGGKNKKRKISPTTPMMGGKGGDDSNRIGMTPTVLTGMLQVSEKGGFPALNTQLHQHSSHVPTLAQITQAATKMAQDTPPFVHLNKADTAPQLTIEPDYCTVRGGMRGYRMSRASHGVSKGTYYYECHILEPPSVQELVDAMPPNVRLGPKLQKQLQDALEGKNPGFVAGHTRIGWSTRSGDLQAPVGYDKWSYGYRDQLGSRVHSSQREDEWGAQPYGVGDVVGFLISMEGGNISHGSGLHNDMGGVDNIQDTAENHIRFFRNGDNMGHYVVTRGKREGGAAFEDVPFGTYHPAISVYLGARVRVNFGPHFLYPPRKLPSGFHKWQPVSALAQKPMLSDDKTILDFMKQTWPTNIKKVDDKVLSALKECLKKEASIRGEVWEEHYKEHVEMIRKAREARNLSTNDLPTKPTAEDD